MTQILATLYKAHFGQLPLSVIPLAAHASKRSMFRLISPVGSAVGVSNTHVAQNRAFLGFTRHFLKHGLPVPRIYGVDQSEEHYLLEDLGNDTLLDLHLRERSGTQVSPRVLELYKKAVTTLTAFQVTAGRDIDLSLCHQAQRFDRSSMIADMEFFLERFAQELIPSLDAEALRKDFKIFADFLSQAESDFFLYRDFQARNMMVRGEKISFIDYQEGRKGPLQYDIVSLLYQSKADLPGDTRKLLLNHYLDALSTLIPVDREKFLHFYHGFIFLRLMQVLGTYGEQGLRQKKEYFKQSIPFALNNLGHLLETVALPVELPNLRSVLIQLVEKNSSGALPVARSSLTISVLSFSYRRGYPPIDSEHGGGFVFDCRCIPNPGREERYKQLTGQDPSVEDYLNARTEAHAFFEQVKTITLQAVESYRARGFNSLSVSFGCTGGQHRSVYFSERLAKYLAEIPGLYVQLRHIGLEELRREGKIPA